MIPYEIGFLHHSGFYVELPSCLLVFDYYIDPEHILDKKLETNHKPLYFFASHVHEDHFNAQIARYETRADGYFLHADCHLDVVLSRKVHSMEVGDSAETPQFSVHMSGSTDAGGSFLISLPDFSIFHAGDLNWWHWTGESDGENREARRMFLKELKNIGEREVDLLFFPVDARQGPAREWGVREFMEHVHVRELLVPMHAFGPRWQPSYEYTWRYLDTPLWIPEHNGDIYRGEKE
jgi:L-ascorbate metabolism protein UlaG (beta-lactamase superfamily)